MTPVVVEYDLVAGEFRLPSGFRTVSSVRVRSELGRQLEMPANEVPIDWRVQRIESRRQKVRRSVPA